MYERPSQPLAPLPVFYGRLFRNFVYVAVILSICLAIGVFGYRFTEKVRWIDALHNASMILSGMGPVLELKTDAGKLFSSAYAIFSGVAFITNISFLLAPAAHRFYHHLHLDDE
jgi:uncharacterized protein involved in cysteine biosynthesis